MNFVVFLKKDEEKKNYLAIESISKIPSFPNMNIWKEIINQSFKSILWNNYLFLKIGKHFKNLKILQIT